MSAYLKSNRGWLVLRLKMNGIWCDEYLNLRDNRDNRRAAAKLERDIKAEMLTGSFDYPARFPQSRNLTRLGLKPKRDALTLGGFASQWLEEKQPLLKPVSLASYEAALRNHLLPHPLAAKLLATVDDGDINRFVADVQRKPGRAGKPLSARALNMLLGRLRTIFATAYRRKLVADDPMKYVVNLRQAKPEVDPFDLGEALDLVHAGEEWERPFLAVLLFMGLRPNEALALGWDAVDWNHGLVRVRRTLFGGRVQMPKTAGSERDVEIPATVSRLLQEQRSRAQLRSELVFHSRTGGFADLDNFRRRNWPRILKRAGVRPRTVYQCRHTCARLLLEQGDTPQHIAAQLGHNSVRMLFEV